MTNDFIPQHSSAFRRRRFLNWFPMGFTYAMLYFGRYNLTVAANDISAIPKEDFGIIFGTGTLVYALSFLINGPVTDRIGGKRAILIGAFGCAVMNLLMGLFVRASGGGSEGLALPLVPTLSALYGLNMYFQSFGAVAIVKVNANWFHVRERGGFSGIFGTMISSGIFFAFTVNGWLLSWTRSWGQGGESMPWWVFFVPSFALFAMFVVEVFLLRDLPSQAGHLDFDTGDASSGEGEGSIPVFALFKRILTNPVILVIASVEFCTGVLRNGIMHWFPFYAKEVWVLPRSHPLRDGSWAHGWLIVALFAAAVIFFVLAARAKGKRRVWCVISGALLALAPFIQGGWGGILMVAGVIGGNVAGWVSDLFFQSRRAPAAGGLYFILVVCSLGMIFCLGGTDRRVGWVDAEKDLSLRTGDEVVVAGLVTEINDWADVSRGIACFPSACLGEGVNWDPKKCMCSRKAKPLTPEVVSKGLVPIEVLRDGERLQLKWKDPKATARAGEKRVLPAGPDLTMTPYLLGILVFLMSLAVIGTHGLLSGTATMDFGGRKAAATAVGMIDGFVYLGTAVQSISLGFLTTHNWAFWPIFLFPFGLVGFVLLTRIWHAKPKAAGGH